MHGWEGETNYVFRTNWQLSKPSMEVVLRIQVVVFSQAMHTFFLQFLCFAGVVTILCFRSQWLMHYHVTLISSDIFRSKWKRSLFVDFLH